MTDELKSELAEAKIKARTWQEIADQRAIEVADLQVALRRAQSAQSESAPASRNYTAEEVCEGLDCAQTILNIAGRAVDSGSASEFTYDPESTRYLLHEATIAIRNAKSVLSETRDSWQPGEQRVVCAAIRDKLGRIITGARHFDQVMIAQIRRTMSDQDAFRAAEQGFIDQFGNFLTREKDRTLQVHDAQPERRRRRGMHSCKTAGAWRSVPLLPRSCRGTRGGGN